MKHASLIFIGFLIFGSLSTSSAQELKVSPEFCCNRYYLDDERIDKAQFLSLLEKDDQAFAIWKRSKSNETLVFANLIVTAGFTVWNINELREEKPNLFAATGGLLSAIAGLHFMARSKKNKLKAVEAYNQNRKKTTFRVRPSKRGFGLTLHIE